MPLIKIAIPGGCTREVVADVVGVWGIHGIPEYPWRFQVTHIPSGYAFLNPAGASYDRCREAIQAIEAAGLDWNFTDPRDLPDDNRPLLKLIREKYSPSANDEGIE